MPSQIALSLFLFFTLQIPHIVFIVQVLILTYCLKPISEGKEGNMLSSTVH